MVKLGYNKAIWALAHRLCLIIWSILHKGQLSSNTGLPSTLKPFSARFNTI